MPLERGDIVQTVTANGALEAVQTVTVGSEVSGKIVELLADYNSTVTNGQVLARLDASTYERQLEQARGGIGEREGVAQAGRGEFPAGRELLDLKLVSQADYDQAEATLAQARASVQVREASLSKVQVDLEKTTIFSPMDGMVISRAVDVGQTVAASLNAPTLFTIAQDLRQMRIEAQISEADVGEVEEGQAVSFTVDAFPGADVRGHGEPGAVRAGDQPERGELHRDRGRGQRGPEAAARHDGERLGDDGAARKRAAPAQCGAAVPSAGRRGGGGAGAAGRASGEEREPSEGGSRATRRGEWEGRERREERGIRRGLAQDRSMWWTKRADCARSRWNWASPTAPGRKCWVPRCRKATGSRRVSRSAADKESKSKAALRPSCRIHPGALR